MTAGARCTVAWLGLLTLTATSFGAAHLSLGGAAIPLALGIASLKAGIVLVVFMELQHEPVSVRVALAAGFSMVTLLVVFVVADVVTRAPSPLPAFVTAPTGTP